MSTAETKSLRRTALFEAHQRAGAKLVPFAGWEMPIQYSSIKEEHLAVRNAVGVFDVSHMGQIKTQGVDTLQRLTSNDVAKLAVGGAQYGLLTNEHGGVIDDLFSYRLSDSEFLTVTNAANHDKDLAWFQKHSDQVEDCADAYAMLAVQGPKARDLVAGLAKNLLPKRFHTAPNEINGVELLIAGTGYTGEDGVELLLDPQHATAIWDALLQNGAKPIGLGARDTLRLEACFHLYGNDLSEDRDPIGAGLGWAVKEDTGFIGSDAIAAVRKAGPKQKLVPFLIQGRGIARQGDRVKTGEDVTG
ncbi:MAG: glycine cleavage system aminomethyltransferase GcvT, partial [Solirubrobacterales bacterium]|nr:glycine cleavage system aminomethyltransferase GcvT [Solirubrobacterales bacterium]